MVFQTAPTRLLYIVCAVVGCAFASIGTAEIKSPQESSQISTEPQVLEAGKPITVFYKSSVRNRDIYLHYGFNGWNLRTSGSGAGSEQIEGNINYYVRQKMTYNAAAGQYQYTFDIPQQAKALHFVFCWDKCLSGNWDNNLEKDYNRVTAFPYIGPVLTWNNVTKPDTGVVVSFEHPTDAAVHSEGWLKYWQAGGSSRQVLSTSNSFMHRFQLTDLHPHTRYYYQVGVGRDYVSKTYSFKTLPQASTLDALSFLVFGDAQDDGETGRFAKVAQTMAQGHEDANFVISTGDMPWNDKPGDWWSFFDKGRDLFASKVLMPALGNHDTPGTGSSSNHDSFSYYFALPGAIDRKVYYRFDVGTASFFAMNSEQPTQLKENGEQYLWMKRQMKSLRASQSRTPSPKWNFAYWHIAPFNAGLRHWQEQFTFRGATGLFNHSLDWHFGGHEHLYQRMKPIESRSSGPVCTEDYGTAAGEGTGYLVIPSGGVFPEGQLVPTSRNSQVRSILAFPDVPASVDRVTSFAGFTRVDLSGYSIRLRTYSVGGSRTTVTDEVNYTKSGF